MNENSPGSRLRSHVGIGSRERLAGIILIIQCTSPVVTRAKEQRLID